MPYSRRNVYQSNWFHGRSGNNPADSTTYYIGSIPGASWSTTAAAQKIFFIRPGRIRRAALSLTSSVNTTNEAWLFEIIKNNTTSYTLATVADTQTEKLFFNPNLNIPVDVGDYIEFTTTTPAWVTNPTNVIGNMYVLIEGELD